MIRTAWRLLSTCYLDTNINGNNKLIQLNANIYMYYASSKINMSTLEKNKLKQSITSTIDLFEDNQLDFNLLFSILYNDFGLTQVQKNKYETLIIQRFNEKKTVNGLGKIFTLYQTKNSDLIRNSVVKNGLYVDFLVESMKKTKLSCVFPLNKLFFIHHHYITLTPEHIDEIVKFLLKVIHIGSQSDLALISYPIKYICMKKFPNHKKLIEEYHSRFVELLKERGIFLTFLSRVETLMVIGTFYRLEKMRTFKCNKTLFESLAISLCATLNNAVYNDYRNLEIMLPILVKIKRFEPTEFAYFCKKHKHVFSKENATIKYLRIEIESYLSSSSDKAELQKCKECLDEILATEQFNDRGIRLLHTNLVEMLSK